ncbi:MAG: ABC transporter permease [Candidatus Methanofastidiosia archaeon]|jgi:peptide/nickel transport system permease protein
MRIKILPRGTLTRFKKNKKGMIGFYMLLIAVAIAIFAPYIILYSPQSYFSELEYVSHPPTWKYPLGTDLFGRDVYSQLIWGFRSALTIALPSAFLVGVIGTLMGLVSGFYSGTIDRVCQRISITFLVWPSVPLVVLVVHSWGGYKAQLAIILGVAVTLWPTTARAIRSEVLSLKNRPFIDAARVAGASNNRIILRHILPNVAHLTFLYITIGVASALVLEATINFLGLADPKIISWGQMLTFTLTLTRGRTPWWVIIPPGLAITYMVLSFFLISMGLRESMRVHTHGL